MGDTAKQKVLEKQPKAEVITTRISRSTTAYRIGVRRGPRAKIWLSSFCATPGSAWGQAWTAVESGYAKTGT
jgi:hypothetical protein